MLRRTKLSTVYSCLFGITLLVAFSSSQRLHSQRRQDRINEWIKTIKQSPKGHSISPSWNGKSPYDVIGVSALPLQNEAETKPPTRGHVDYASYSPQKYLSQGNLRGNRRQSSYVKLRRKDNANNERRVRPAFNPHQVGPPSPDRRRPFQPNQRYVNPPRNQYDQGLNRNFQAIKEDDEELEEPDYEVEQDEQIIPRRHSNRPNPHPQNVAERDFGENPFLQEENPDFPRKFFEQPPRAGARPPPPPPPPQRVNPIIRQGRPSDHIDIPKRRPATDLDVNAGFPPQFSPPKGGRPFRSNRPAVEKGFKPNFKPSTKYFTERDVPHETPPYYDSPSYNKGNTTPRPIPTPGPEDFPRPPPRPRPQPPPTHPTHPPRITHPPEHFQNRFNPLIAGLPHDLHDQTQSNIDYDDDDSYWQDEIPKRRVHERPVPHHSLFSDRNEEEADEDEGFFYKPPNFPSLASLGANFESMKIRTKRSANDFEDPLETAESRRYRNSPRIRDVRIPRRSRQQQQQQRRFNEFSNFNEGFWEDVDTEFFPQKGGSQFGQRNQPYRARQQYYQQQHEPSYRYGPSSYQSQQQFRNTEFGSRGHHGGGGGGGDQQSVQSYQPNNNYKNSGYSSLVDSHSEDNEILGSGNFDVIKGGTFYDPDTYHHTRYNNYNPRPHYNADFFENFRDFADIKKNQGDLYRDRYYRY